MKKIFIVCLLILSGVYADTITATQTVLCCPTKDKTDSAYSVATSGNKRVLAGYLVRNHCTVISEGQNVERVDVSFSMIKIVNNEDYRDYWCPVDIILNK